MSMRYLEEWLKIREMAYERFETVRLLPQEVKFK